MNVLAVTSGEISDTYTPRSIFFFVQVMYFMFEIYIHMMLAFEMIEQGACQCTKVDISTDEHVGRTYGL